VNLVGEQFLQLALSVEVADLLTGDKVKTHTPKIRNNVMLLLSGKQVSDLVTREGKENLAREIRDLMNEVLEPDAKKGEGPIKDVLFTSFIMQ
jgi:flagellar FliL protein